MDVPLYYCTIKGFLKYHELSFFLKDGILVASKKTKYLAEVWKDFFFGTKRGRKLTLVSCYTKKKQKETQLANKRLTWD